MQEQQEPAETTPIVESFGDLNLSSQMMGALDKVGYEKPTPVQGATIPLTLSGLDLIVQAQTGTGKTAAFAIPVIEALDDSKGFQCLVLAPTRELAKQVCREFEALAGDRLNAFPVYGGVSYGPQIKGMNNAEVICATPGRLLDHLKSGKLSLDGLRFFILDEADEMLSMGFEKEIDAILEFLPPKRQCLLFSATVNEHIKSLAGHFLVNPEYVSLSSDSVAAQSVDHTYFVVDGMQKQRDLVKLIEAYDPESALIFCNTRNSTQIVTKQLERLGYTCDVINGDLPQRVREKALANVKEGRIRFLVGTDVAARGIDISDLPCVINYTMPENPESYIHRTGRTGRAGQQGIALTLLSPQQIGTLYQLKTIYKLELTEKDLPTREEIQRKREERMLKKLVTDLKKNRAARRFAPYLGIANQLVEREDSPKILARLVAYFDHVEKQQEAERAREAKEELRRLSESSEEDDAGRDRSGKGRRNGRRG